MTAEGQKRNAARAEARKRMGSPTDAVQNQSLSVRCILMDRAGPPMLPGAYNNNYQIIQSPGYVMILVEMIHEPRIIPLDGRPHLPQHVRTLTGNPVGRWEGETLVVETTNFTDKTAFQGSSENMRLVERFTRVQPRTRSSINSRSTILRRGRGHGPRNCPCRKRLARFSSTPATKATKACTTRSPARGPRRRRRRKQPPGNRRSSRRP